MVLNETQQIEDVKDSVIVKAISHHLSNIERNRVNYERPKATMSWCSKCESKRDAQTILHRDIMAAENMCRIGASFLLGLSGPNDLNP